MIPTYRFGYGPARLTLREMRKQPTIATLDPEFWRRLARLMREARKAGRDVGIGGAARTSAQQELVFRQRHVEVVAGGCCTWGGKRWAKKANVAHAAPPGRSYHEPTTPVGGVLAVDVVGWEDGWVGLNCLRYGLRDLRSEKEPWHLSPADLPASRAAYLPSMHPLAKWKVR